MPVFHQMGHHSNNLVDLPEMSAYAGAIFSPINYGEAEMAEDIQEVRATRPQLEIVFDPQLYVPATDRGKLKNWRYFRQDVDTADLSSIPWWTGVNQDIVQSCQTLEVNAVCSPAVIPKVFDDRFYAQHTRVGSELTALFKSTGISVLQTVVANMAELAVDNRPLEIASIVSGTDADRAFLVFVGSMQPRREFNAVDELKGAMRLINALERNGVPVVVGFCSSELILWKAAGATSCASGKFFNLRRFTRQRFEEPTDETGGGQLPYWFEEGLLAFLRQGDLGRVRRQGLLSEASGRNPFCQQVLALLDNAATTGTKPKWLALAWRQFLYWFCDAEGRITRGEVTPATLLEMADANWTKLDQARVLMEERPNDGAWIRSWLNALREYGSDIARSARA